MQLVDIGFNLGHRRFDADRAAVLDRARAAGVVGFVATGIHLAGSADAIRLAETWPDVWCTAGVHPHNAKELTDIARLRPLLVHPKVVAAGEMGLDFDRNFSTPAEQERAFAEQLGLAREVGKPVFLHCRQADRRFLEILDTAPGPGVVHCYTGGPDFARACLDRGLHFGVTGWVCDDRRAADLRAALPFIPADRLMIETDAPFLSPRDLPAAASRNEPRFLPHVCAAVARWARRDPAEVAATSTAVARAFFRLA
jgi:TatD DNase family protein